jgi:outer membrane protein assembly factor BamB
MRRALLCLAVLALVPAGAAAADWPTFHGDNTRQGDDSSDPGLSSPTSAWTSPELDGQIYAQPVIQGSQVIVATENNTVYSLNAATGAIQWSTNLGIPRTTAITCGDITPQGITSTPAIDGGNIYVVANIQTSSSTFFFELASLSLAGGTVNWTKDVDPDDTSNPSGSTWSTEALAMEDRGALLVTDGLVLIPMGGNAGDCGTYHGYVVSYPESGTGSVSWWASSEVDSGDNQAAIWATGGLSEDASGYVYAGTGNSSHGQSTDAYDYSDGVIKLDPTALAPGAPVDYFAPSTWYQDNANDADLGSATPLQLPGDRIFQVGKSGMGYLLNSADLGHIGGQVMEHQVCHATSDAAFGSLAYADGVVYVGCSDGMAAVQIASSDDDFSPLWYNTTNVANHPPTVAGGVVWSVSSGAGQLLGLSASTGALVDTLSITGSYHFTTPSAANGQLYVAGGRYVDAFVGSPPAPSRYQPLAPYRVLDTRSATCVQCSGGALGPGQTRTIQVGGYTPPGFSGGIVPSDATSVVLNVTGVFGTDGTYLTVFPAGETLPTASTLNPQAGDNIANLTTVALGTSGASPGYVSIYNSLGSIDVVVDVEGYYTSSSGSAGEFHALTPPVRVCDTRGGQGTGCNSGTSDPLSAGEGRLVAVTDGSTGVSTSGAAEAAVLNLTAVAGTASTYLTVYPPTSTGGPLSCGAPPTASDLNVPGDTNRPNRVIASVVQSGGTGYICVFNDAGTVNVAVDVNGWFGDGTDTGGALFHALTPYRICDTRSGSGTVCAGETLGQGGGDSVQVDGAGPLPASGMVALAANVTAVSPTSATYLTVYPDASSPPPTSDLNPPASDNVANFTVVAVPADGDVDVYNSLGSVDFIIDVVGWFQ